MPIDWCPVLAPSVPETVSIRQVTALVPLNVMLTPHESPLFRAVTLMPTWVSQVTLTHSQALDGDHRVEHRDSVQRRVSCFNRLSR